MKLKRKQKATPHAQFCNVDLDIESKHNLAVLEAELRKGVVVLEGGPPVPRGSSLLRLETARSYANPDDTIHRLCSLLEKVSPKAKRAWRSAYKKEFDVGYEVAGSEFASQFSLRTDTLKRISSLGATLG